MKNVYLVLLLFIFKAAWSSPFPIIDSLTAVKNDAGATYTYTQKVVDIGPAGDVIIPSGMFMALGHKHREVAGDVTVHYNAQNVEAKYAHSDGKMTASELGLKSYNSGEKDSNTIEHSGSNSFQECVGYIAGIQTGKAPWDSAITPGGCMMVPPSEDWCKITSPEIVLDHGTITLQQAEGDIATSSLNVLCTTDIAVTFNLLSQDSYIYLDEGKSEISVHDQPLNSQVDLVEGNNSMPIKDVLSGITTEGFHTGSSVLVMMPY